MSGKMDMRVSGSSRMPGGEYGCVSISGSGKIEGDLKAEHLRCSGAAKVLGNAQTKELSCSGACSVQGDAAAQNAAISGSTKIGGSFAGGEVKVHGGFKVEKDLHCTQLIVTGGISVADNAEAEQVKINGAAQIGGLLNAEGIELTGSSVSRISEIGCAWLKVRRGANVSGLWDRLVGRQVRTYTLQANTIEADTADLEYTQADVIRGRDIYLGEGCRVRRVEYTGDCRAPEGTVEQLVKV